MVFVGIIKVLILIFVIVGMLVFCFLFVLVVWMIRLLVFCVICKVLVVRLGKICVLLDVISGICWIILFWFICEMEMDLILLVIF